MHLIVQFTLTTGLILSLLMFFVAPSDFSEKFMLASSLIGVGGYLVATPYIKAISQTFSWSGLYNMFCLGFMLVHFHNAFLSFFLEDVRYDSRTWYAESYAPAAVAVSSVGFLAFLITYVHYRAKGRSTTPYKPTTTIGSKKLHWIVVLMSGVSLCFFVLFFAIAGEKYRSGVYSGSDEYWGTGATYGFLLFQIFLFSSIVLDLYSLRVLYERLSIVEFLRRSNPVVLAVAAIFFLVSLYVGDRGPMLQLAIVYAGAYSIFFGKIRLHTFLICIILGIVAMAFIGRYRTSVTGLDLGDKISEGKYRMEQTEWYHPTMELGTSIRTVSATLMVTEEGRFFKGFFKLNNAASCIPFASRFLAPNLGLGFSGATSSKYLTAVMLGPESNIGVGTTVIADIYIDFGWPGVIVLMGVIGWFFSFIEKRATESYSLVYFSLFLLVLSIAFYWGRAPYLPQGKFVVWSVVCIRLVHYYAAGNLKLNRMEIVSRYRRLSRRIGPLRERG